MDEFDYTTDDYGVMKEYDFCWRTQEEIVQQTFYF